MAGYTPPFMLVKFRISWQMILLYFLNNLLFTRPIQIVFFMDNQIRKVKRHNDCLLITPVLLVSLTVLLTMWKALWMFETVSQYSRIPIYLLIIIYTVSRAKVLCTDFCSLHGRNKISAKRSSFMLLVIVHIAGFWTVLIWLEIASGIGWASPQHHISRLAVGWGKRLQRRGATRSGGSSHGALVLSSRGMVICMVRIPCETPPSITHMQPMVLLYRNIRNLR